MKKSEKASYFSVDEPPTPQDEQRAFEEGFNPNWNAKNHKLDFELKQKLAQFIFKAARCWLWVLIFIAFLQGFNGIHLEITIFGTTFGVSTPPFNLRESDMKVIFGHATYAVFGGFAFIGKYLFSSKKWD